MDLRAVGRLFPDLVQRAVGAPDDVVAVVGAPDDVVAVVGAPDDVVVAVVRTPDDVVAVVGLGNAPVGADSKRVCSGIGDATGQHVISPEDVLAPHPLHWNRGSRLGRGVKTRQPYRADGIYKTGALFKTLVAGIFLR